MEEEKLLDCLDKIAESMQNIKDILANLIKRIEKIEIRNIGR